MAAASASSSRPEGDSETKGLLTDLGKDGWIGRRYPTNRQLFTGRPFVVFALWSIAFIVAKYFYMTNVYAQLLWVTGEDRRGDTPHADMGALVFSAILPAAAVFTPATSYVLDHFNAHVAVVVMGVVATILGATSSIQIYGLQYVTIVGLVFNRFFYFAAAPFLLQKMYGERGINVVYGVALFVAAACNTSNYLWTYLSEEVLHSFLEMNAALNAACLASSIALASVLIGIQRRH